MKEKTLREFLETYFKIEEQDTEMNDALRKKLWDEVVDGSTGEG